MTEKTGTVNYISAEKKARRGKQWGFPVVLLFCMLIFLAGAAVLYCLYWPVRYSEREAGEYVKAAYGDGWKLQSVGRTGEAIVYTYTDTSGNSFSVFSTAVPVWKDGVATGRTQKALSDNYYSRVIESRMDALKDLQSRMKKNGGLEMEIETSSAKGGLLGAQYYFRIYVDDSSRLEQTAKYVSELDSLMSFAGARQNTAGADGTQDSLQQQNPVIYVYLKPNVWMEDVDAVSAAAWSPDPEPSGLSSGEANDRSAPVSVFTSPYPELAEEYTGNWSSPEHRTVCEISRIPFSDPGNRSAYSEKDLALRLENDYVDAAKTTGRDIFRISDELWDKYPAPVLTLKNIGGHELSSGQTTYRFIYHRKTGTYWMTGLDPCEDYDGNPYGEYTRRGVFRGLISYLGGQFSASRKESSWRIGTAEWTARRQASGYREALQNAVNSLQGKEGHLEMKVRRDGNSIELDPVPAVFAGTGAVPSERPFSIRDLIHMLDVHITINQKEMTAVMVRDYMTE